MTENRSAAADGPSWSLAGLRLGALLFLPSLPGMIAFGIAVGATAAHKGFDLVESILMNALVYAGASQMLAMEAWPARVTLASLATLALLAATVNARMLLFGASLRPWLGPLPAWQIYPMLQLSTDPGWLIFFTHDISPVPTPYGCTAAAFDRLVRYAVERRCQVLTVDAALDRMGLREQIR